MAHLGLWGLPAGIGVDVQASRVTAGPRGFGMAQYDERTDSDALAGRPEALMGGATEDSQTGGSARGAVATAEPVIRPVDQNLASDEREGKFISVVSG